MRARPPQSAAAALALAVVLGLAFSSGGYFAPAHLRAGAIVFLGLAILLAVRRPALSTPSLVALGALVALAAWTGLSAAWSSAPDPALSDAQRTLLYVGLLALGLFAVDGGRATRPLLWGLLGVLTVVAGAGVASRVAPGLVPSEAVSFPFSPYRLSYPLSYWNAYGALCAMAAVLGAGLAADIRVPVAARAAAAAAAALCAVGMYLSLSRGAWLALALGVVVLVALSPRRAPLGATVAIVAVAAGLAILRLRAYPALVDDPTAGSGQVHQGRVFAPQLVVLVALAGVAQAVLAEGGRRMLATDEARRAARRIGLVAAGLAVVVLTGVYAVSAPQVEGHSASALGDGGGFLTRQYREFLRAAPSGAGGTARLTNARGTRSEVYRVALAGFGGAPIAGEGAGSFPVRWARERRVGESVLNAHSLYLETADELGLVGLGLLLTLLGAVGVTAVRSRRGPAGISRGQAAAASAAFAVWAGHAAIDWDWQMPALTGAALLLACAVLPRGRGERAVPERRRRRTRIARA